jgi:hypothetical protein
MSLGYREHRELSTTELASTTPAFGAAGSATDESNVLVSSGIHRGRFPVGGMTVRAARRVLGPLVNIDPSAVAVINGQIVAEDTVLEGNLGMLSFVKPSSLKG